MKPHLLPLSVTTGLPDVVVTVSNPTVRTQEVPLVHAPCYIIALTRMRSRFEQYKVGRVGNLLCGRATYETPFTATVSYYWPSRRCSDSTATDTALHYFH
jgi:hypothetical protein